jgi:type III secretory pathway component EscU
LDYLIFQAWGGVKSIDKPFKSLSPDVQISLIHAGITKFELITGTIKSVGKYICMAVCIWIILRGFADIGQLNSSSLRALSTVVKALQLHTLVGYLAAAIFGVAWQYERAGKKRAIKKAGEFRKKAESNDSYRSSSGLRENGDTPDDQRGDPS